MAVRFVMIDGLSDRIREQRKRMGLTQGELAELIGGGIRTVNDYERGAMQPSYARLLQLAEVFNVSTDYLLGVTKNSSSGDAKDGSKEGHILGIS